MKRQRRTLGLLLAGLSIALVAIGRQGQPTSQSPSTSARAAKSADPSQRDGLNCPVPTGNLAWLARDPRCSMGAQEVLRINAEEDGLGRRTDPIALRRAKSRYISWLQPAWAAYSVWDFSSDRTHASLFDCGALHCGARLGWSGCMVYRSGNDRQGCASAASQRGMRSPHRFARTFARLARQATSLLSPWPNRLAGQSEADTSESIRISRLPNPVAPESAKPQAIPGGDLSSASDLVL
jgi:hypothetical protein